MILENFIWRQILITKSTLRVFLQYLMRFHLMIDTKNLISDKFDWIAIAI